MQLVLYKLQSADNVINKTFVEPLPMTINLRRGVDIVSPVLRIAYAPTDSPNKYNYCHILELERFYFIRSMQAITNTIWELALECDVIESYKVDILSSNARYNRNIRTGDYQKVSLGENIKTDVALFESGVSLVEGNTMIMTTVGGGA